MDDWFRKTILKLNKGKVQPLANVAIDKFLQKVVLMNVLSL